MEGMQRMPHAIYDIFCPDMIQAHTCSVSDNRWLVQYFVRTWSQMFCEAGTCLLPCTHRQLSSESLQTTLS